MIKVGDKVTFAPYEELDATYKVGGTVTAVDEFRILVEEEYAAHRLWGYSDGGKGTVHSVHPDDVKKDREPGQCEYCGRHCGELTQPKACCGAYVGFDEDGKLLNARGADL